jgi:hypothetical protein
MDSFIETDICKVIEQFLNELKNSKQLKIDNELLQKDNKLMRHELDEYETKINKINKELNEKNDLLRSILENTSSISRNLCEVLDSEEPNDTNIPNDPEIKLDMNKQLHKDNDVKPTEVAEECHDDLWSGPDYLDYPDISWKAPEKRFKKNKKKKNKKNKGKSW